MILDYRHHVTLHKRSITSNAWIIVVIIVPIIVSIGFYRYRLYRNQGADKPQGQGPPVPGPAPGPLHEPHRRPNRDNRETVTSNRHGMVLATTEQYIPPGFEPPPAYTTINDDVIVIPEDQPSASNTVPRLVSPSDPRLVSPSHPQPAHIRS